MDTSATMAPADRAAIRTLGFEFRGKAGEYFGIWIVNLLLTIVTFGIYSAWAKVRRLRYFYGNTFLDGHNFEYHARPMQILIGRIIVIGILAVMQVLITFHSAFLVLLIPYMIALPWLLNKAIAFNARVTSYRNIRFSFEGNYWSALGIFLLMPLAAAMTAGILSPVATRMAAAYIGDNTRFGGARIRADADLGNLYANWFASIGVGIGAAILFSLVFAGIGFAMGGGLSALDLSEFDIDSGDVPGMAAATLTVIGAYIGIALSFIFYAAGNRNVVFNGTRIEGGHRLASNVSRLGYTWVIVSNLFVTILTLTLMHPWAAVRTWRYLANGTSLTTNGTLDAFVDEQAGQGHVTAAEFLDIEGIDIGL